jgi:hypothetical protein
LAGKWFDSGEGDRKIVRDIAAQNKDGVAVLPIVKYRLIVTTGSKKGAGSDANFSVNTKEYYAFALLLLLTYLLL